MTLAVVTKTPDLATALELFSRLAEAKDIAHGFLGTGCAAKAHLICKHMIDEGYEPVKAWARDNAPRLGVRTANGEQGLWDYHVAAALNVEMPDGSIAPLVFDTSLFSAPATLAEWGETIGANPARVEIAPLGQPPSGAKGDYTVDTVTHPDTDSQAQAEMMRYLSEQPPLRVVFEPAAVKKTAAQAGLQLPSSGDGWVTPQVWYDTLLSGSGSTAEDLVAYLWETAPANP